MKRVFLFIFFISSAALADISCEDTQEYKFYDSISSINSSNWIIAEDEKLIRQQEGLRRTPQVNETINSLKTDIKQLNWVRNHSFRIYKDMGGTANDFNSLERLKSPCSEEYSDDHPMVKTLRDLNNMEEWIAPDTTPDFGDSYMIPNHPATETVNLLPPRNYNQPDNSNDEGNGRSESTARQGDQKNDLSETIDTGIKILQLFNR